MFQVERLPRLPGKLIRTKDLNFSWETKQEALKALDWRCQVTNERGTSHDPLEVHHGLAIAVWFHYYRDIIPQELLVSAINAIPLKRSVHKILHEQADMVHWGQMAKVLTNRATELGYDIEAMLRNGNHLLKVS